MQNRFEKQRDDRKPTSENRIATKSEVMIKTVNLKMSI